jgi:hypothetical protein
VKGASPVKPFDYFQPTEILFGGGRVAEVGEAVARFGKRCLVVTERNVEALEPVFQKVQTSLEEAGVAVARFDGVIPNPTTDTMTAGGELVGLSFLQGTTDRKDPPRHCRDHHVGNGITGDPGRGRDPHPDA